MEISAAKPGLAPLPVRLAVFAVMVVIALGAIWLIDRRAMERMIEFENEQRAAARSEPSSKAGNTP